MITLTYDEAKHWKSVVDDAVTLIDELERQVRNLTRSHDELLHMYALSEQARQEEAVFAGEFMDRSMETIDEKNRQVERLAATVNDYADETERLKQVAHQNAVAADGMYTENIELSYKMAYLALMAEDYRCRRGRFGGTGIASELDDILAGNGYIKARKVDHDY